MGHPENFIERYETPSISEAMTWPTLIIGETAAMAIGYKKIAGLKSYVAIGRKGINSVRSRTFERLLFAGEVNISSEEAATLLPCFLLSQTEAGTVARARLRRIIDGTQTISA